MNKCFNRVNSRFYDPVKVAGTKAQARDHASKRADNSISSRPGWDQDAMNKCFNRANSRFYDPVKVANTKAAVRDHAASKFVDEDEDDLQALHYSTACSADGKRGGAFVPALDDQPAPEYEQVVR
ncbi:hypothetical protein F5Y06DRAFT_295609 [Hypoxylon sp. FL0890]|nr:hypothetical protein F5Y06DRAFT_295609 [Hypoxylon sp. FL0890]